MVLIPRGWGLERMERSKQRNLFERGRNGETGKGITRSRDRKDGRCLLVHSSPYAFKGRKDTSHSDDSTVGRETTEIREREAQL